MEVELEDKTQAITSKTVKLTAGKLGNRRCGNW